MSFISSSHKLYNTTDIHPYTMDNWLDYSSDIIEEPSNYIDTVNDLIKLINGVIVTDTDLITYSTDDIDYGISYKSSTLFSSTLSFDNVSEFKIISEIKIPVGTHAYYFDVFFKDCSDDYDAKQEVLMYQPTLKYINTTIHTNNNQQYTVKHYLVDM